MRILQKFRQFRRGPEEPALSHPGAIESINWPEAKAELIDKISKRLEPLGLKFQSAMQWTETPATEHGMRRLFRVHDAGGLRALTLNWGYSFDFVPHISGAKVKFHRTFASAQRDLWFVPQNLGPRHAERIYGKAYFDAGSSQMIDDALPKAVSFWQAKHSLEDLALLLAKSGCLPLGKFAEYEQGYALERSPFSLPFVLAALGKSEAEATLQDEISYYNLSDSIVSDMLLQLRKASAAAKQST